MEETPLFQHTISLDLPTVLISCFVRGDDLDEYDLKERVVEQGLGERIIISNDEK